SDPPGSANVGLDAAADEGGGGHEPLGGAGRRGGDRSSNDRAAPTKEASLRASHSTISRVAVSLGATLALGVGLVAGFAPGASLASSHREAPLLAADPRVDTTDTYAFVSPDHPTAVSLVSNWFPFETPAGGPNFYSFQPGVRYEFRVDNDGDAQAEQIYRLVFTNHYRNLDTFLYNTGVVNNITDQTL